jgi:hypothetical protein
MPKRRQVELRAGMRLRSQGWGMHERDRYHPMSTTDQTKRFLPASHETLLQILETLPGAVFVLDGIPPNLDGRRREI